MTGRDDEQDNDVMMVTVMVKMMRRKHTVWPNIRKCFGLKSFTRQVISKAREWMTEGSEKMGKTPGKNKDSHPR